MTKKLDIEKTIDSALDRYLSTAQLLRDWLAQEAYVHEFLILACARLDSLSNLAYAKGTQRDCFLKFIQTYSSHRQLFAKVSVPNLYFFLSRQAWVLPGTITKPGRLHMFDPKHDARFITFLWNSKVSLTEADVGRMLSFLMRTLKAHYRVAPNQKLNKVSSDTPSRVLATIKAEADKYHTKIYRDVAKAISPLLSDFTLASLLYQEYRCAAIHGYKVELRTTEFFKASQPYWSAYYHDFVSPGRFLNLHFPAAFLLKTLHECTENYKQHLKTVQKLPAELFFEFCDVLEDLEYLDEDSIATGKDVGISGLGS